MAGKKYYWLKLHKDFFKRHEIRVIESMENGKDYILFYLKLLVESVSHEGNLRFSDLIPYNDSMLASITNTNVDVVRSAMKIFKDLNMIDILDDETIYMAEVESMIGTETKWAEYKRAERIGHVGQSLDNVQQSIEIRAKSIEKKDNNIRHQYGEYKNVLLDDKDYEKLQNEFPNDYQERIDNLSRYMRSTGKSYKDHLATIRNWARMEKKRNEKVGKTANDQIMTHDYDIAEIERKMLGYG